MTTMEILKHFKHFLINCTILFITLFSCIIFGQFNKLDSLQFNKKIDQIIADTKIKYVYESSGKDSKYYLRYVNPNDKNDIFLITYNYTLDGRNLDFDKKGEKKWNIISFYGKYLSLFPIWNKYFDTSADIDVVSKKGRAIGEKTSITFRRYENDGFWKLRL